MEEEEGQNLEAQFTLHVISLFSCLYDSKANPYIGPIEVNSEEEEEEEDESEIYPPFNSAVNDYRLHDVNKAENEARQHILTSLSENEHKLKEQMNTITPEPIIIGERLPICKPSHFKPLLPENRPHVKPTLFSREKEYEKAYQEAADKDYERKRKILKEQEEQEREKRRELSRRNVKLYEKRRSEREQKRQEEQEKEEEALNLIRNLESQSPRKPPSNKSLAKNQAVQQKKKLQKQRQKKLEAAQKIYELNLQKKSQNEIRNKKKFL